MIRAGALALGLALAGPAAMAEDLTGLCLDLGGPGCQHRYVPWNGASIDLCEESCTLTNPVRVRGMAATLYDFDCVADYDTPMTGRVMVLRQDGGDGARMSLVTRRETIPIVPCPR